MRAAEGLRWLLIVIVASIVATLAFGAFANTAAVPIDRDFTGVDELQLNGGTLTLKSGPANRLTASVPIATWPLMMIRVTEGRFAERLMVYGIAGDARLEGLDLKLPAGNFQECSTLTASGRVDVYSALETAGGVIDTSQLTVGHRDPGPITCWG